jgi:TfoX/Sxy family transcriptional regulator of competence genes
MSSELDFVQFVVEQMEDAGIITNRKMFGDYGIYCNGIIFGLICDNKIFIKPTEKGRAYIGEVVEEPPYPGARNYFFIEEKFENRDWISELVKNTILDLKEPKPKKKIIKRTKKQE